MLDVRCAVCGSDDIYVKFPSTYNDEVKSVCMSCGNRGFVKSEDELPVITIEGKNHKSVSRLGHPNSRAARRKVDFTRAIRKKNLADKIYRFTGHGFYPHTHQYSKNKIHCSCPLCAAKSKSKNGMSPTISDIKKYNISSYKRVRSQIDNMLKRELEECSI